MVKFNKILRFHLLRLSGLALFLWYMELFETSNVVVTIGHSCLEMKLFFFLVYENVSFSSVRLIMGCFSRTSINLLVITGVFYE